MKAPFKVIILVLLTNLGCQYSENSSLVINAFESSNDTLVIRTEKQKGHGIPLGGFGTLHFTRNTGEFPYPVTYPENLRDIERTQVAVDHSTMEPSYIDIIKGRRGLEDVFVVDQNNNHDFTDDSIRIPKDFKPYHGGMELIKCQYLMSDGRKLKKDSSWIHIILQNERLLFGRCEQLTANFQLDGIRYKIGIADPVNAMAFTYDYQPELVLISKDSDIIETSLIRNQIKKGEYLNLNGTYYIFDSITVNGSHMTFVKGSDFNRKVGTQIGMIAPEFTCVSVDGDTIRSTNLHDKPIVISNSCGCGGDELSTQAYFDMRTALENGYHTIRLDSKIENGLQGIQIDVQEQYNRDIYNKYRGDYCSRISYVIGENKRILDKFEITDWEAALASSLK